jgi:hypothetical protein
VPTQTTADDGRHDRLHTPHSARGHNVVPGPTLLELLSDSRLLGMRSAKQVLPAGDRTATNPRFGVDDQEEPYPAARRPPAFIRHAIVRLARTTPSHVAQSRRLDVTHETAPFRAKRQ